MNTTQRVNAILEGKNIRKVISENIDDAIVKGQAAEAIHVDLNSLHKVAYRLSDIIDDNLNCKGVYCPAKICTSGDTVVVKFGPNEDAETVLTEETSTEEDITAAIEAIKETMDEVLDSYDLEVVDISIAPEVEEVEEVQTDAPTDDAELVEEPVEDVADVDDTAEEAEESTEEAVEDETADEIVVSDVPETIIVTLESKRR